MRLLPWLYFLAALAAIAWLGRALYEGSREDPRQLLDAARHGATGPQADTRRALSDLDQALRMAESQRDEALVEEILLARARISRTSGGLTQARADLERVLTHHRPGSGAIEAQLAAVELTAGEPTQALARVDSVLRREPSQPEAWSVRARALLALAEREIAAARTSAGTAFADAGLADAERRMRKVAALSVGEPDRTLEVRRLIESLPDAERSRAQDVVEALDRASDLLAAVPTALAQSFRGPVQRDGIESYLRLLRASGRLDSAVDFGLAVRGLTSVENHPPFLLELMTALLEAGRVEAAADLVPPTFGAQVAPSEAFFETWCTALYRAQRWRPLISVANSMRAHGDEEHRSMATFYMGVAQSKLGGHPEAAVSLLRYLRREPVEPFEGALALAWQSLADGNRAFGQAEEERAALATRLQLDPERYEGAGECWLRMAELALASKPPRWVDAELGFARAIALLPERRAELEPRWREAGEVLLRARKLDIEQAQADLVAQGLAFPTGKIDAYQLLRHAERHLEEGRAGSAVLAARRILGDLPRFLPAIDVAIEAALESGDLASARDLAIERARFVCVDAWCAERLDEIPRRLLEPRHVLELVRVDPERFGRRLAARALADSGRAGEALAGLERIPAAELGDAGHALAAELAFALGRYERAQRALASLTPDVDVLARALPLALQIAARERDTAHAARLVRLLETDVALDAEAMLASAEQLIAAGAIDPAAAVLDALDERARWRSAGLYVLRAQVAQLRGDPESAAEEIERALAFDAGGAPEVGALLLAADARAWNRVAPAVDEVEASGFQPGPVEAAALALLGERYEEAAHRIARGQAERPDEPLWKLLLGAHAALTTRVLVSPELALQSTVAFGVQANGEIERDPRPLLARVVASGCPPWRAFVAADLDRAHPGADGTLWTGLLAARAHLALGRPRDAELAARALVGRYETFVPGWDVLEAAVAADVVGLEHPRVLRLAEERREALGESERTEDRLARARVLAKTGELDGALAVVDDVLARAPDDPGALRTKSKLLRERGEWRAAVAAVRRALELTDPGAAKRPVSELLDLVAEAEAHDPSLAATRAFDGDVEFAAARFDRDPLAEAEAARRELALAPRGDLRAADACLARLDAFRARTGRVPVDELRDGASRAWMDLIASVDPEAAAEFLRGELERQPGSVDLWRMLGETAAARGETAEAKEAYRIAIALLPDGPTARALADLIASTSGDLRAVRPALAQAARIEGLPADDPRLETTLARALVRGGEKQREEGLALLAKLWTGRAADAPRDDVVRIGQAYGVALCSRGRVEDRDLARAVLAETAPLVDSPSRRAVIEALATLARLLGS